MNGWMDVLVKLKIDNILFSSVGPLVTEKIIFTFQNVSYALGFVDKHSKEFCVSSRTCIMM